MSERIICGDARAVLAALEPESVQCVVTSPPYWGLRAYGTSAQIWGGDSACEHEWGERIIERAAGYDIGGKTRWNHQVNGRGEVQEDKQDRAGWTRKEFEQGAFCQDCGAWRGELGLEPDFRLFVEHMVDVFAAVHRVLRKDGVLWVNLGDSYAGGGCGARDAERWPKQSRNDHMPTHAKKHPELKDKDLSGIPWRVALALQEWGWWLRQDNIWTKPNVMPESVTDRTTRAHEYVFMFTKSARYYYDAEAIKEPASANTHARIAQRTLDQQAGGPKQRAYEDGSAGLLVPHTPGGKIAQRLGDKQAAAAAAAAAGSSATRRYAGFNARYFGEREPGVNPKAEINEAGSRQNASFSAAVAGPVLMVNKRSVWTIPTQPRPEAHFASFPDELPRICILAGSSPGDTVLDPFGGRGTVAVQAKALGRNAIHVDLNPDYCAMAERNVLAQNPPLPFDREATA